MVLKYNEETERYNDFHCGESFKVKVNGKWKVVRIELGSSWYVIDEDGFTCRCDKLEGAEIQEL